MAKLWNEKLKEWRLSQNLTQIQLSKNAEVSQPEISVLEKGEKNVTLSTLEKILKALNYTYQDLFVERTKEEMEMEIKLLQTKLNITEPKEKSPPGKWKGKERRVLERRRG